MPRISPDVDRLLVLISSFDYFTFADVQKWVKLLELNVDDYCIQQILNNHLDDGRLVIVGNRYRTRRI